MVARRAGALFGEPPCSGSPDKRAIQGYLLLPRMNWTSRTTKTVVPPKAAPAVRTALDWLAPPHQVSNPVALPTNAAVSRAIARQQG